MKSYNGSGTTKQAKEIDLLDPLHNIIVLLCKQQEPVGGIYRSRMKLHWYRVSNLSYRTHVAESFEREGVEQDLAILQVLARHSQLQ